MVWAVDQGADVVSMSLGGDTDDGSDPLAAAVNELSATSDTLFVIAAGNNGGNGRPPSPHPASADAALTVGAVDVHDVMAGFSSRGPRFRNGALKPEVVAPGVDVTAARAAGTELGPSSTSLHDDQRHLDGHPARGRPGRDPQAGAPELGRRAAEGGDHANSTVPVADATGFDAGTGRVDAARAVAATCSPRRRSPGLLRVAVVRPADDAHDADLHEHRRRSGDARPLARRAGRSRGGPGRRLALGPDAHGSGRRRGVGRRAPRPEPAGTGSFSGVVMASNPPGRWPVPPSASASRASITT